MGLWSLLEVSSMPILQLLIISLLGAAMATQYLNLLPPHACKSLNRIVFVVFTPALIFASLAKTVHFQDIISWWFMAANIGITFLVGGILGWIAVKILKPQPYLQDLIIAMCATGNFANILLVIIPAICSEDGSPFGDKTVCRQLGLSYVSFSMAIGSFYTWTYTYHLIQSAKAKYCAMLGNADESSKEANNGTEANETASLLLNLDERVVIPSNVAGDDKIILDKKNLEHSATLWTYTSTIFHRLAKELKAPPVLAAILGFLVGAISFLRNLIIGDTAPLRALNESITLLGDGTIPCITLILGGNLTQGISKAQVGPMVVMTVIGIRYLILPVTGIFVVKVASYLGFLPSDPLYHFILMIQFALPPGINIGTMTQLFDVAQEECSMLYLWTYLVAAFALTGWSIFLMWILS
ncbi:protein PIN-LIKES 7-like isoform X1 [Andrographis paniculata]|uniref:protein PIN-LIKES 7-like isoform X1 n=1 Tax=Andrographis paniculata TaxID=175694 RepID=UPI0021E99EB1|nr:protein PIN-LIKES 7-like isoform X1 [Andrographis paniculata]